MIKLFKLVGVLGLGLAVVLSGVDNHAGQALAQTDQSDEAQQPTRNFSRDRPGRRRGNRGPRRRGARPGPGQSLGAQPGGNQPAPSSSEAKPNGDAEKPTKDDEKSKDDKSKSKDKDKSTKSVARPDTPPEPPDPEELKVRPDEHGKVRFRFRGQPWQSVLEWLADISGLSLDWQTMPVGYLNLTTQSSYTIDEARDLVNERLLTRGYTMLRQGEVLAVVKIEGELDPSMVPRVAPQALDGRDLHEFVKVSFGLRTLLAETAVEEFQPMLSRNGSLKSLKTTNRLEAMDAVVNLLDIRDLLAQEESTEGQDRIMRKIPLRYTAAAEVKTQLEELLGIEKKKPAAPMTPQQRQQAAQRAAQLAQQNKGKNVAAAKKSPAIHLVALVRENAILAHAPPDKMAIIEKAIEAIDVARDSVPLAGTLSRVQIYRLQTVDPEPIVKVLREMGGLDYDTRLEVDKVNKAIVADASLADHVRILQVVNKLDGSGRTIHVIQLPRQLKAKDTAAAIKFMMTGEEAEEEATQASSPSGRFNPFGGFRGRRSNDRRRRQQEVDAQAFRVQPNVRTNSLQLWANQAELDKVNQFIRMLGENAAQHEEDRTVESYRLTSIDPTALLTTLETMEALEFTTQLQADEKNRSLIVTASAEDHKIIKELITKLDTSGREFSVIKLRHLPADYVAGSIEFLLDAGEAKPKGTDYMDRYNWYPYTMRMKPLPKDPKDTLRVEADVENNQLLVWANEIEMLQVKDLLVKLGEIPPEGGNLNTMRVLNIDASKDLEALVEKIRRSWTGPNELQIDVPETSEKEKKEKEPKKTSPPKDTTTQVAPRVDAGGRPTLWASGAGQAGPSIVRLVQLSEEKTDASRPQDVAKEDVAKEDAAKEEDTPNPPPISISRGADGGLVISSEDTKALDQLEKLVARLTPPRKVYETFVLKYVDAYSVTLSLREFFEEKDDKSNTSYNPWYWGPSQQTTESGGSRLSRRRPLQFIWEPVNNSILVQGASPSQLHTIRELIAFYDQRERADSESVRQYKVFQIKYSKARVVADTVKDVFRDLLSKNDKALQTNQKEAKNTDRVYNYNYGYSGSGESEHKVPKFQGLLSIGVDELTQTLIVQAPKFVMTPVAQMIEELDNAAKPLSTVKVVTVGPGVSSEQVQVALKKLLGESRTGKTAQQPEQQQGEQQQGRNQGNNSRRGNDQR